MDMSNFKEKTVTVIYFFSGYTETDTLFTSCIYRNMVNQQDITCIHVQYYTYQNHHSNRPITDFYIHILI